MTSNDLYRVWIVLKPAADLEGRWTAHCLDWDVVTYGTSIEDAWHMILDAMFVVLNDDLARSSDPRLRANAPKKHWDELFDLMREGERIPLEQGLRSESRMLAAMVSIKLPTKPLSDEVQADSDEAPVFSRVTRRHNHLATT